MCHVGKEDDRKNLIDATLKRFGKIDLLVSNAAVNPIYGGIEQLDEKVIDNFFSDEWG